MHEIAVKFCLKLNALLNYCAPVGNGKECWYEKWENVNMGNGKKLTWETERIEC